MPQCTVTYSDADGFTFAPDSIEMDAPGNITFVRGPGSTWTFTGFSCPDDPDDFSVVGTPGATMVVRDNDANPGTYSYSVSISSGKQSDPQIINKT